MKNESFRTAASRAIDEGSRERQATALRLASQFETSRGEFDLSALERLGEEGLAAFLSNLRHQKPLPNWRETEPIAHIQSSPVPETGNDYGWATLRSREPRWFVLAAVGGWTTGFALVVIGSMLLRIVE